MGLFAAGAAVDAAMSPIFQHLQNVKNRKFAREMYKTQRADSLSDWAMQNEYNSPRAQMQRFQEAGLNPHLIYGQGNEGNAQAVRSSSAAVPTGEAPSSNVSGKFMQIYDMKMKKAQMDNLLEVNQNLQVDRDYKKAQIAAVVASTGLTETQKQNLLFELGIKTDLRDTTIDMKKAELENIKIRTNSIHGEIARAWDLHPGRLKEQAIDILNKHKQNAKLGAEVMYIDQMIKKVQNDIELTKYDRMLIEQGVNPKDPWLLRNVKEILANLFGIFK